MVSNLAGRALNVWCPRCPLRSVSHTRPGAELLLESHFHQTGHRARATLQKPPAVASYLPPRKGAARRTRRAAGTALALALALALGGCDENTFRYARPGEPCATVGAEARAEQGGYLTCKQDAEGATWRYRP